MYSQRLPLLAFIMVGFLGLWSWYDEPLPLSRSLCLTQLESQSLAGPVPDLVAPTPAALPASCIAKTKSCHTFTVEEAARESPRPPTKQHREVRIWTVTIDMHQPSHLRRQEVPDASGRHVPHVHQRDDDFRSVQVSLCTRLPPPKHTPSSPLHGLHPTRQPRAASLTRRSPTGRTAVPRRRR